MVRIGILVDTQKFEIVREVKYDDKLVDDFYVKEIGVSSKEGANLLYAAFIFPIENSSRVSFLLEELKEASKKYEDIKSRIFYKDFAQLRKPITE